MVLDTLAAMERLDNDQELYDEICEIYLTDAPELLRKFKEAIHDNDSAMATRHAHSLKSVSANIGATALSDVARQAEIFGKSGDLAAAQNICASIEKQLSEVLKVIRA